MVDQPNDALLTAHAAGDERAFRELVRRYTPRLRRYIQRFRLGHEDIEDVLQEAFWRVHMHAARFDVAQGGVTNWIYTIVRNLTYNMLRNAKRKREERWPQLINDEGFSRDVDFADPNTNTRPDIAFDLKERLAAAYDRINSLPKFQRVVFILREVEGRPYEEIAHRLGIPVGTLKSRLARARVRIVEEYAISA